MPCLRIKLPDNQGEFTQVLAGQRITIGRRPDNTIQVIHLSVSGHHAELIASAGHYRLHDLGSTNLTCVDEQPITDFHLHKDCKISFGSVECEFLMESHPIDPQSATEMVPTRADLEFLRRENLDLQSKLATQQKQIDILSSARLITTQTTQLGVAPEAHRRIVAQRDELRTENQSLKRDMENMKADLITVTRERDAIRQAWETVKTEIGASRAEIAALTASTTPAAPSMPQTDPVAASATETQKLRPLLFSEAPAALEVLKKALGELASNTASMPAREAAVSSAAALNRCTMSTQGHPVQRLASELFTLLREIAPTEGALEAGAVRTLNQAAELIGIMLLPAHLNQLKNLPEPKLLAIERDADLLGTMDAALQFSDIGTTGIGQPEEALALLDEKRFNAILLDVGASEQSALDFCDRIRALPGGAKTPLILLTLAGGSQPVTPGNLRGGNDVLEKPLNIVELSLKAHIWIFRDQLDLV